MKNIPLPLLLRSASYYTTELAKAIVICNTLGYAPVINGFGQGMLIPLAFVKDATQPVKLTNDLTGDVHEVWLVPAVVDNNAQQVFAQEIEGHDYTLAKQCVNIESIRMTDHLKCLLDMYLVKNECLGIYKNEAVVLDREDPAPTEYVITSADGSATTLRPYIIKHDNNPWLKFEMYADVKPNKHSSLLPHFTIG